MGSRIVLCGEIHLSKEAFERAQDSVLIEFFSQDPDDEVSFHPKGVTAKALFTPSKKEYLKWARNSYEPGPARWVMSASLHDDDWQNADPEMLTEALAQLKNREGRDLVVAFTEWNKELDGAWLIDRGRVTAFEELPALPDELKRHLENGEIEKAVGGLRSLFALEAPGELAEE